MLYKQHLSLSSLSCQPSCKALCVQYQTIPVTLCKYPFPPPQTLATSSGITQSSEPQQTPSVDIVGVTVGVVIAGVFLVVLLLIQIVAGCVYVKKRARGSEMDPPHSM